MKKGALVVLMAGVLGSVGLARTIGPVGSLKTAPFSNGSITGYVTGTKSPKPLAHAVFLNSVGTTTELSPFSEAAAIMLLGSILLGTVSVLRRRTRRS